MDWILFGEFMSQVIVVTLFFGVIFGFGMLGILRINQKIEFF